MKTICCECCGSLQAEKEFHVQRMDEFHEHFSREHRYALSEYKRLEELLRNVVWYNFETVARSWRSPWPESYPETTLTLHGMRYDVVKGRGGHKAEKGAFPIYYKGTVRNAPPLPPEIVLAELEVAYRLVKETDAAAAAPYEWAPGGRLYERMVRTSPGVAAFSSKVEDNTKNERADKRKHIGGTGLLLGDRLERQISTHAETTATDILGRVCGDRSLVCTRAFG